MTSSDFIKLYDANGREVSATPEQLRRIARIIPQNRRESAVELMRQLTNHRSGHYWLVADRKDRLPAMLLQIHLFHAYPRTSCDPKQCKKWTCTIEADGIADTHDFGQLTLERVIARYMMKKTQYVSIDDEAGMPASVAAVARRYVQHH